MYSVYKHVYMDDGVDTVGFAIDKENLKIFRAKIDTVLIDDDKPSKKKTKKKIKSTLSISDKLNNYH